MPNSPGMPSRPQAAGATTGSTQEQSKEIILPGSQVHAGQRELTPDDLDAAVTGHAGMSLLLAVAGEAECFATGDAYLPILASPGDKRTPGPRIGALRASQALDHGATGGTRCNVPSPLRASSANPSPSPCA